MIEPTINTGVEHADGWREFLAQVKQFKCDSRSAFNTSIDIQSP